MSESKGRDERVYCVIPHSLGELLHESLREHFRGDPSVDVVVDLRRRERRSGLRRRLTSEGTDEAERRRIRADEGRRVADRRAMTFPVTGRGLPPDAEPYRGRLLFVQRLIPREQRSADAELLRMVLRFQSGDKASFEELYLRTFSSVYSYLRVLLKDSHEAEDATQHVMMNAYLALPRYQLRQGTPFRAWLFRIARNEALTRLKQRTRIEPEEPERIDRLRESARIAHAPQNLQWLSDADLMRFVERLPLAQRQALVLRYMLDLSAEEIGEVLDRTPGAVRHLEMRALRTLEERLTSVGRSPLREDYPSRIVAAARRQPVLQARRAAL